MSANAGSGQPSATIGKPSRRSTVATVRAASGLSAVRKFRQAAPPERRHRPPVYPATVRAAGTRASRGDRSTVCRKRATVRAACQSIRQAVATMCRAGSVRPVSGSTIRPLAGSGQASATIERRAVGFATIERGDRSTVPEASARPAPVASRPRRIPATIERAAGFRNRSTVGRKRPRRRNAAQPFAPVSGSEVPASRGDRVPPASDDSGGRPIRQGKPRRNRSRRAACQRFRRTSERRHRSRDRFGNVTRASRGDRVPRLSAVRKFRQAAPPDSATVRPLAGSVRQSRASRKPSAPDSPPSPETRRKRPPLRPPVPDGFAPVPPRRALARPFNAA